MRRAALPQIESREFGQLTYDENDVYLFPSGLPGFAGNREFLLVERGGLAPFCFLQSVAEGGLRFICLPTGMVDGAYQAEVGAEFAGELEIEPGSYGPASEGVQVLAILTIPEAGPATANLLAPVVLAPGTRRGCQCIQFGTGAPAAYEIPWMVRRAPQVVD